MARAALTMTNTIVAGNAFGDVEGNYTGENNLVGGNPQLAPLGDYGGPTPTMPLAARQPGDRRRDDRRRHPDDRPARLSRGAGVDIGAYQSRGG